MSQENEPPDRSTRRRASILLAHPATQEAWRLIQGMDAWVLDRQVELTAIPSPPFGEGPRGERMAALFRETGLTDVRTDEAGNVLARPDRPESANAWADGALILSAHLDTVFPPGTDVTPLRGGEIIRAPGICDDGRGLAALLGLARVLTELPLSLPFPIVFAATVGEEGAGDLRGVRHLFRPGGEGRGARGFISLDGTGLDRIVHRGVGSVRLHMGVEGPGGHSWTDWGRSNPIHALGRIVAAAQALALPSDPRTTLTVARWGGGESINAIPREAWIQADLRSEGAGELLALEEELLRVCRAETGADLQLKVEEMGRRPAGLTHLEEPLVEACMEATRAVGAEPVPCAASTDANLPMSLGIPALAVGAGGTGGGVHTPDEWYRNKEGPEGILRALLTVLLLASEEPER